MRKTKMAKKMAKDRLQSDLSKQRKLVSETIQELGIDKLPSEMTMPSTRRQQNSPER